MIFSRAKENTNKKIQFQSCYSRYCVYVCCKCEHEHNNILILASLSLSLYSSLKFPFYQYLLLSFTVCEKNVICFDEKCVSSHAVKSWMAITSCVLCFSSIIYYLILLQPKEICNSILQNQYIQLEKKLQHQILKQIDTFPCFVLPNCSSSTFENKKYSK